MHLPIFQVFSELISALLLINKESDCYSDNSGKLSYLQQLIGQYLLILYLQRQYGFHDQLQVQLIALQLQLRTPSIYVFGTRCNCIYWSFSL